MTAALPELSRETSMERSAIKPRLKLDPRFAEAYADRGSARMAKGDPEGAGADLNHAIKLNANLSNAYFAVLSF